MWSWVQKREGNIIVKRATKSMPSFFSLGSTDYMAAFVSRPKIKLLQGVLLTNPFREIEEWVSCQCPLFLAYNNFDSAFEGTKLAD